MPPATCFMCHKYFPHSGLALHLVHCSRRWEEKHKVKVKVGVGVSQLNYFHAQTIKEWTSSKLETCNNCSRWYKMPSSASAAFKL